MNPYPKTALVFTAFFLTIKFAVSQGSAPVFSKSFDNEIKINVFETTQFPNPNNHIDWSGYGGKIWHLESVKDYTLKLCTNKTDEGKIVWTNRQCVFHELEGSQKFKIYDAALVDGQIHFCYSASEDWFLTKIPIKPINLSSNEIVSYELFNNPVVFNSNIDKFFATNAMFGVTSNGTPKLNALGKGRLEKASQVLLAWKYVNNRWVIDAENCRPAYVVDEISGDFYWILKTGEYVKSTGLN